MKKIPIFMIILVPLFILTVCAGIYLFVQLIDVKQDYTLKSYQASEIEEDSQAVIKITYSADKDMDEFDTEPVSAVDFSDYATYTYENITFVSDSSYWVGEELVKLCDELMENTHGSEMDELEYVVIYSEDSNEDFEEATTRYNSYSIPLQFYNMLPADFTIDYSYEVNSISLYSCDDNYTDIESIAYDLSLTYGRYFVDYYFGIGSASAEELEDSEYYKLRNTGYYDIDCGENEYSGYSIWDFSVIASSDYVYFFGSDNAKLEVDYWDTLEQLRVDVKSDDSALTEYFANDHYATSFNKYPHDNITLPLPDQVEGLAELMYSVLDEDIPEYTDRTEEAESINITVQKRSEHGQIFYVVSWDTPWEDENVTYTLVGYNEYDYVEGAIKTIDGTDTARAIIGGAVVETTSYINIYESDKWSRAGFVRLRVIVTFDDGTAVVSPSVDWSFE